MTSRPLLTPSTDHPITIERNPNRIQVRAGGSLIADTANALTLRVAKGDLDLRAALCGGGRNCGVSGLLPDRVEITETTENARAN